jgi:hypothetical protein
MGPFLCVLVTKREGENGRTCMECAGLAKIYQFASITIHSPGASWKEIALQWRHGIFDHFSMLIIA